MTGYILLAHGSRHPGACDEVTALADATARCLGHPVAVAYLDLVKPSLLEVGRELVCGGENSVIVTPLLFSDAYHNRVDVPREAEEMSRLTGLDVTVTDGIGTGADLKEVLLQAIREDASEGAEVVLYYVGSAVPGAEENIIALAEALKHDRGRPVHPLRASRSQKTGAALVERAQKVEALHLLPLFVTHGVLLEHVTKDFPQIARATDCRMSYSAPLGTRLAGITTARLCSQAV